MQLLGPKTALPMFISFEVSLNYFQYFAYLYISWSTLNQYDDISNHWYALCKNNDGGEEGKCLEKKKQYRKHKKDNIRKINTKHKRTRRNIQRKRVVRILYNNPSHVYYFFWGIFASHKLNLIPSFIKPINFG